MKRVWTDDEVICRFCDNASIEKAGEIFTATFGHWKFVQEGLRNKSFEARAIEVDGVRRYMLIWQKIGTLFRIVACAQLVDGSGEYFPALFTAAKKLAKLYDCNA